MIGTEIGSAAGIKALRHILIKGQMALLIEASVAARRYGLEAELFKSVAEWYDSSSFMANADRVLRTVTVHAKRRAEEADMAKALLTDLGIESIMTAATSVLLHRIGDLGLRVSLGAVPPASAKEAIDLMQAYATKSQY